MKFDNRKVGIGIFWNLSSLFMTRGSSIVFTLILAHLLEPEAFGLIAIMVVFYELANVVVESGMGQALIRNKEVFDVDLSTAFNANVCLSLIVYIILYIFSPQVAEFYSQQELELLLQVSSLVVFVNALKVVQTAVISRQMNFRLLMKANTLAAVGGGLLAVVVAYMGGGVWSLVVQLLSTSIFSAMIIWTESKWRPRLIFSRESFERLFGFGAHLLVEGLLTVLFLNSYVLVIGKLFTAEVTGLYYFAKKISQLISEHTTTAVQQATLPALATLQDDDQILRDKYREIIQVLMFVLAPIILFIAAIADPLFELLFNEKWKGAVLYLEIMSVMAILFPLHAMNINILSVKGRSDLILRVGIIKKSINLLLLIASIPFGVTGIIIGQVIGSILALIPNTYFSARLIDYGLKEQIFDVFRPVFLALIAAFIVWWLPSVFTENSLAKIIFGLFVGGFTYLFGCYAIKDEGYVLVMQKLLKLFNNISFGFK